jgi:DNA repair protein RecO (recombination protein O)
VGLYRDRGVVLRTVKLGEADRIVTILTLHRGKVRAVAKGLRKTGSRFGGRLEPTSHVALQCYEGRELDVVTQVETIDVHRRLREDYASLTTALAMVEATDQVAQEHERNPLLYQMVVRALLTLDESPSPVMAAAFFWKLLSLEGFHPVLEACAGCDEPLGAVREHVIIDLEAGGVLCRTCAGPLGRRASLGPAALGLVRRILGGDLRGALAVPEGPAVREAEQMALDALEHHVERRLRSAPLLAARHRVASEPPRPPAGPVPWERCVEPSPRS